ncbi:hypothetical protein [Streptosporangium sp. NPDC087985]|uniref:hypothetical protein n=1 Tax=Streptosporangium sp. NPDC087985 TaxID=3366196 RepID=UPI003812ACB8
MTTLAKMVATARTSATALTWEKVAHLLTDQLRADLDRLLVYDAGLKMTRLAWLIRAATDASATSVKTAIDKLLYLRNMDAHTLPGGTPATGTSTIWACARSTSGSSGTTGPTCCTSPGRS